VAQRCDRLLVTADYGAARALLFRVLRQNGFHVTELPDEVNPAAYLVAVASNRFDLIVCDIRMPGAIDLVFLEDLHQVARFPPMLIITVFASNEMRELARQLGTARLVDRPFDIAGPLAEVAQIAPRRGELRPLSEPK
jgi:CheY-like chemotaxis protein